MKQLNGQENIRFYEKFLSYLKVKKIVSLPKAILLVDEARGIKSLLRADDLKPPPQFVFDETQESYIIRDYLPDFTTTSALTVSAPASDTSISATGSQGMPTSLSVSDSLVQDSNSGNCYFKTRPLLIS